MRPLVLPSASTEYVPVRVRVREDVNPTSAPISLAFMQGGIPPSSGNWVTAAWDPDDTTDPPTYWAQTLVGASGAITLPVGEWAVWIRIEALPEEVIHRVGRLVVAG